MASSSECCGSKQARMGRGLRGVIEKSVSICDGFVNCLGGDLISSYCSGLSNVYFEKKLSVPWHLCIFPLVVLPLYPVIRIIK